MRQGNRQEERAGRRGNGGSRQSQTWDVLTVREGGEKKFWTKIGVAFENDGGSFRVLLDALPLDGKLTIMPPK